jgi:hypothetical protein
MIVTPDGVVINIDDEVKKVNDLLKNSKYEYLIFLSMLKDGKYPSFGHSKDYKKAILTMPYFDDEPTEYLWRFLNRHKKTVIKELSQCSEEEKTPKLMELSKKYLRKELSQWVKERKYELLDILTHECTHLIDDLRRTKSFKAKEQKLGTEEGDKEYFNNPSEQNAYYQETIANFDEWIKDSEIKEGYKNFDLFIDTFIRQYRGSWESLNDKNKKKLKKRIYAYWKLYIKE